MQQPPYPPPGPQGYPPPQSLYPPQAQQFPPYQQPPPPFYQAPPGPPPNWRPPVGPPPKQRQTGAIVVLVTVVVILIIAGGALAAANASNQQAASQSSSSASTPTVASSQPTALPTPTPKLTLQQQTLQIAKKDLVLGEKITSTAKDGTVTISEYIDTTSLFNEKSIISAIKRDCFNLFKDLWQAKLAGLKQTELRISGPTQDQYGKESTSLIGRCQLQAATAANFNWKNLYSESAWDVYDDTYLLPSLLY